MVRPSKPEPTIDSPTRVLAQGPDVSRIGRKRRGRRKGPAKGGLSLTRELRSQLPDVPVVDPKTGAPNIDQRNNLFYIVRQAILESQKGNTATLAQVWNRIDGAVKDSGHGDRKPVSIQLNMNKEPGEKSDTPPLKITSGDHGA